MPVNVEIKARISDLAVMMARAQELSGTAGELLEQEDTFFVVPSGRLKLRVLAPDHAELIGYRRQDGSGPRASTYHVYPTANPNALRQVIGTALEIRGTVRKKRWLFLVGNTRLHLDEVEGLGSFVELEVVLRPEQTLEDGAATAHQLMRALGIEAASLLEEAYIDLLERGD